MARNGERKKSRPPQHTPYQKKRAVQSVKPVGESVAIDRKRSRPTLPGSKEVGKELRQIRETEAQIGRPEAVTLFQRKLWSIDPDYPIGATQTEGWVQRYERDNTNLSMFEISVLLWAMPLTDARRARFLVECGLVPWLTIPCRRPKTSEFLLRSILALAYNPKALELLSTLISDERVDSLDNAEMLLILSSISKVASESSSLIPMKTSLLKQQGREY